ncbi:MAG TPA: hypothetical protein VF678_01180, partial [bacterium]
MSAAADAAGLNVQVAVDRAAVDAAFAQARHLSARSGLSLPALASPADLTPPYRTALVLGSAGRPLWERLLAASEPDRALPDPLDALTERSVEPLLDTLRAADPTAQSAFPFRHARQLVPFQALTESRPWAQVRPLGILVHPRVGPWFAWRAVLLTALEVPTSLHETREAPCVACASPCVASCPARAVDKAGFRWGDCVDYRLAEEPCRDTCLAR